MPGLVELFPQPVMLTLGGVPHAVSMLQIRDMAELEACERRRAPPHPDTGSEDRGLRRAALRANYDRATEAEDGDAEGGTADRAVRSLWLSLRKASPRLAADAVAGIASSMTVEEWDAFNQVAWDADPVDRAMDAILAEIGVVLPRESDATCTWAEAYLSARRAYGLSLKQFGDLYLSQWRILQGDGKRKGRGVPLPAGWSWERYRAEVDGPLTAFWKEGAEATPESSGDS